MAPAKDVQVFEVSSEPTSPRSTSQTLSGSSGVSASSSTSNNIPQARHNSSNTRTLAGTMPHAKVGSRGSQPSVILPKRDGQSAKTQQCIRNPASQGFVAATRKPERFSTRNKSSNNKYSPTIFRVLPPAEWKSWDELRLRIFKLPSNNLKDLVSWFSGEGNVSFAEIRDEAPDGTYNAILSFRPPPARPFWEQRVYSLRYGGQQVATCRLGFPEHFQHPMYRSPVRPYVSYPENMSMKAESLDFGLLVGETMMLGMKNVTSTNAIIICLELNMKYKELRAVFRVPIVDWRAEKLGARVPKMGILNREEDFKFKIPLEEMIEIHESPIGHDRFALSFTPLVPPSFFKRLGNLASSASPTIWTDQDSWYRQTDVVYNPNSLKRVPLTLKKAHATLDLGRWTTYRFVFSRSKIDTPIYQKMRSALEDFNVKITPCPGFVFTTDKIRPVWEYIDRHASQSGHVQAALQELVHTKLLLQIPFTVRYQLEVCISLGCFTEFNLDHKFVQTLAAMELKSASDLLEFVAAEKKPVFKPASIFDLKSISGATSSAKIPDYCAMVRSATITPTTIRFHSPSVETSNRVIRQYSEHADRFLRVRFRDEQSESKIFSTNKETMNEVFRRIKRTLSNGLQIGDRRYEFLGYGNSQLREHSAYFFAPTAHVDAARIRMWMGSFQDIKTVAKYGSRLGQCFSTTRAITGVVPQIQEVDDIHHKGYCFTDGVGKISPFLTQLAASELGVLQYNQATPSVFQFRLGGCKGVLTVSPTSAPRELHLRLSQYKFPASHEGLEIIRWSQYACAKLNRQLILVLSTLGVADEVFRRKMENQLRDLREAMTDSKKALILLQKYVDHNQMTLTIASMITDGFHQSGEPFMLALLHLWKAWSIKYLKEKAQIAVDGGAILLGCVDETNQLRGHYEDMHRRMPGTNTSLKERSKYLPEIFVQLSRDRDGEGSQKPKVILGPVLLTRSPILHPGDLRVVCCVDVPELHHIKDAVVLPQNGDRDLASMCSGGDLDGDDFLVIWDSDLLPKEWNHTPMDYSAPPPLIHGRDITVDDLTTFFVTYMRNDSLGAIATAHVAQADQADDGVKNEKCLRLAQLHSQAVDFAKTGQPAVMTPDLRPRRKPHFQVNKNNNAKNQIYHSEKILGQLYDQVQMSNFSPMVSEYYDSRILEAFTVPTAMLVSASNLKKKYDAAVHRIMAKYDIKTEFEVWSTFVLSHSWSNDFKFHEEIGQVSGALKHQFREQCIEAAGGKQSDQLPMFAAAMYRITAEECATASKPSCQKPSANQSKLESHSEGAGTPFISFPWIFSDILGKIVQQHVLPSSPLRAPSVPAPSFTEETSQLTNRGKSQKGRYLANTAVQVPDLETTRGTVHPGDLFKPFESQYTKDLEELDTENKHLSHQVNSPDLSSSISEEMEPDECKISAGEGSLPSMGSATSEQSSTFEQPTIAVGLGGLDSEEVKASEEYEDAEEIILDFGAERTSSKLLEAFADEEVEEEVDSVEE